MRRKAAESGFTLIEVMFSLIVFIVSLMGMVALQRVSSNGAAFGKRHTAAVNVASFFLAELQGEFAGWPVHEDFPSTDVSAANYPLLAGALGGDLTEWHQVGPDQFRVDEYLGHSNLTDNDATSRFCVNYMLTMSGDNNANTCKVWKVRVRVSWTKRERFEGETWKSCAPGDEDDSGESTVAGRIASDRDEAIELVGVATRELAGPYTRGIY